MRGECVRPGTLGLRQSRHAACMRTRGLPKDTRVRPRRRDPPYAWLDPPPARTGSSGGGHRVGAQRGTSLGRTLPSTRCSSPGTASCARSPVRVPWPSSRDGSRRGGSQRDPRHRGRSRRGPLPRSASTAGQSKLASATPAACLGSSFEHRWCRRAPCRTASRSSESRRPGRSWSRGRCALRCWCLPSSDAAREERSSCRPAA
mmetsp:Transcript_14825/g.56092  ORF Transcript_14825/g.56092 Transcript_14825/m.56092 type:complete len:203 (+) Transcript_14825:740-1348(+)